MYGSLSSSLLVFSEASVLWSIRRQHFRPTTVHNVHEWLDVCLNTKIWEYFLFRFIKACKTLRLCCIFSKLHWKGFYCISCQITVYILFYHPEITFHQRYHHDWANSTLSKVISERHINLKWLSYIHIAGKISRAVIFEAKQIFL